MEVDKTGKLCVERARENKNAYGGLVRKPEGKRPLGRPRRKKDDNSQIELQEIGWETCNVLNWLRVWTSNGLL
jgi:hypothetical protein